MKIRRTDKEFILLPSFTIDYWFEPELKMWQRVYTIGWLMWFVRWTSNKVVFDFETQSYENYF
jgi:hypothetical protein